jgi:hypothetical protein
MSSPAEREKKGACPAKQDGIDEGTFTSFPSPPHCYATGPLLSRFTGEDNSYSNPNADNSRRMDSSISLALAPFFKSAGASSGLR